MPKISIIVPVYNVEDYLKNCIDSILNQTFNDFELILVNDGSTDNSLKICKYYKSIDYRICIIDKHNEGLSSARNAGLDVAKGEYIGFVDSDDYIHPQMYEILYNYISDTKADISICNFEQVYNFNKDLLNTLQINQRLHQIFNNIESLEQLSGENAVEFTVSWNKLYRKYLFENIRFKVGIIHEDEFIIHKLLYKTRKIVYIREKLYFYMQRKGSIMQQSNKRIDRLYALEDRIKFFNSKNLKDLQFKQEVLYIKFFLKLYNKILKMPYSSRRLVRMRLNLFKLIIKFYENTNHSKKEKASYILFCISPFLYKKLVRNKVNL